MPTLVHFTTYQLYHPANSSQTYWYIIFERSPSDQSCCFAQDRQNNTEYKPETYEIKLIFFLGKTSSHDMLIISQNSMERDR